MRLFETIDANSNQGYTFLISLIAVFLPVSQKISGLAVAALLLFWIAEGNFKKKFSRLKENHLILLFLLFFAILLFTMVYTENTKEGFSQIEKRLSVLLVPLVIGSVNIGKKQVKIILVCFLLTILFTCIYGWSRLAYAYITSTQNFNLSYYQWYLPRMVKIHAPYWAMYLAFTGFISYFMFAETGKNKYKLFFAVSFIILNLTLLFIASRTAILANFVCYSFIFLFLSKKRKLLPLIVLILTFLLALLLAESYLPYLHSKLTNFYGTGDRFRLWNAALEVFKSSPILGTGVGDAIEEIQSSYRKLYNADAPYGGDVHSEYLSVATKTGLLGVFTLISLLILSLLKGLKNKSPFLIYLPLLFIMCFFTESVLSRYSGVMLFSLFLPLSAILNKTDLKNNDKYKKISTRT